VINVQDDIYSTIMCGKVIFYS